MPVSLSELVNVAKDFVNLFKVERITFLICTSLSALAILILGGYMLLNKTISSGEFFGLFGATGVLTYSASQILSLFDKCLKFIKEMYHEEN